MPLPRNYIPPPPPEGLGGTPVSPEFAAQHLAALSSPQQPAIDPLLILIPSTHPELNTAIETNNAEYLLEELARLRRSHGTRVCFNDAVNLAIRQAKLQMLRLLIDDGIPVDDKELELAARCGHIPILEYLMQHFEWHIDHHSCHGQTVLTLAVEHYDTVAWLLQQGANVNEEDAQGETALSRAVEKGPLNVMTLLFDAGADVTRGTPLRAALLRKAGKETINLMQEMLARGAPVDKFFGETSPMVQNIGFNQLTALHIACGRSYRNYEAVRLLLAHGANPALNQLNQPLYAGEAPNTSALEEARRVGNDDIVSLITAHMREVNGSSKSNL